MGTSRCRISLSPCTALLRTVSFRFFWLRRDVVPVAWHRASPDGARRFTTLKAIWSCRTFVNEAKPYPGLELAIRQASLFGTGTGGDQLGSAGCGNSSSRVMFANKTSGVTQNRPVGVT